MQQNLIARASVTINAATDKVWDALLNAQAIKQYMVGTTVVTDWRERSPIVWKGNWQGRPYEDKGVILQIKPGRLFRYSHFSPLTGLPDKAENYHTVTIELSGDGHLTRVSLEQDNNLTDTACAQSKKTWQTMLAALKKYLEQQ